MENFRANPYFIGVIVSITVYLAIYVTKRMFFTQVDKILVRTSSRIDDFLVYTLAHTTHLFMLVTALYVGFHFVPERKIYPTWAWRIFYVTLMMQVGIWGIYLIKKWMLLSFHRRRKRDPASASSINILELMLKFTFLSLLLMFALNNMGIQITTMIAGLGVGGVAIALAMQNILGDLFSSLSIILDKPFMIGDFIIVGEWMGEVENIGLKTTRIRSLGGEQIIISNSDLLGSRIRNMKRLHERRNIFFLSLPHETPAPTIQRAIEIIKSVIQSKERIRFDRCHFMRVTATALDMEIVYFVQHDDFNIHMDLLQHILLDIHARFMDEGIRYAYPVQKMYMLQDPAMPFNRGNFGASQHPSRGASKN
jgi:small-conductance mechanosensitive channel